MSDPMAGLKVPVEAETMSGLHPAERDDTTGSTVSLYRKKPTVVEAAQVRVVEGRWNMADARPGSPLYAITWQRHPGMGHTGPCNEATCYAYPKVPVIHTTQGYVQVRDGDWIAHQNVDGRDDYWPISAATFAATYEPIPVSPAGTHASPTHGSSAAADADHSASPAPTSSEAPR